MANFLSKLLSALGLTRSNGKADRKALVKRLPTLPRLSEWIVDPFHSSIQYRVMHMGLVEVRGRFRSFNASFRGTSPDFSDMQVVVEVDVASLETDMSARDAHLRSADFFDAEKYPKATFRSTKVEWRPLRSFRLYGDLTLKGKTHPIYLDGKLESFVLKDMVGHPRVSFTATATIDRRAWGLTWQIELEGGELVADNLVTIEASVELMTPAGFEALKQLMASMGITV